MRKNRKVERELQKLEKWILLVQSGCARENAVVDEVRLIAALANANDFLRLAYKQIHFVVEDEVRAEVRCDPSDGPFLSQEPEEPDGFCDCPECCGE